MKGYSRAVRRVLLVVLGLNVAVAVGKLLVGWRAGSLSILGDGLHSGVDATGNLVGLMLLRLATRPPDADHPYGHAKFETMGAFALAALLGLTALELARAAIARLGNPHPVDVSPLVLGMLTATLVVNLGVVWYETRMGRRWGSHLLLADAAQTRSDVFVTLAILATLPLQAFGWPWIDALLALGVAGFIAHAGLQVFRETMPVLTDRIAHDPAEVARVVMGVRGVVSVHDIRSRGGPRDAFVQMHLVVDATDVAAAHAIADEVEKRVGEALQVREVFVHIEPEDDASGPPGTHGESLLRSAATGLEKG